MDSRKEKPSLEGFSLSRACRGCAPTPTFLWAMSGAFWRNEKVGVVV